MQINFHCGRRTGVPREAGDYIYTPESLVMVMHLGNFGAVWNWPMAISVTRPALPPGLHPEDYPSGMQQDRDGGRCAAVERHAIVDVTRIALWIMATITVLSLLAAVTGPFFLKGRRQKYG
jgi:hypothetical protein